MTTNAPIDRRRRLVLGLLLTTLVAGVALAPDGLATTSASTKRAPAYGWPLAPFWKQHPVRGFFGDPRVGRRADGSQSRQFHFGIDVSGPDGTPVYATLTGTATIHPLHADVVLIVSGSREFSYWHVVPSVRSGTHVTAYRTVIGRIEKSWEHVHFSERVNGVYLNPLRPGALGPYRDTTRPTIAAVVRERRSASQLDLVAEVFDDTPLPVAAPWNGKPVMPAVVRWRLRGPTVSASAWTTAVDFRLTIPDASLFDARYASGTTQNHPSTVGRYRIYLARGLDLRALRNGRYTVEVVAGDGYGHTARATAAFVVRGGTAL
jgi:hypothetical protein